MITDAEVRCRDAKDQSTVRILINQAEFLAEEYDFGQHKRAAEVVRQVSARCSEGPIVDVGAGTGYLTYLVESIGRDCVGLDLDPGRYSEFHKRHDLAVEECDIERDQFPIESNTASGVILSEVFEHLRIDPLHTLSEINRILKPSGTLVFTTPNYYSLGRIARMFRGKGLNNPVEQYGKLEERGHMGHIRIYSRYELEAIFNHVGFANFDHTYTNFGTPQNKSYGVLSTLIRQIKAHIEPVKSYHLVAANPANKDDSEW